MAFKVSNLGSKQPYFNNVYVVREPKFSFRKVKPKQVYRISIKDTATAKICKIFKIADVLM